MNSKNGSASRYAAMMTQGNQTINKALKNMTMKISQEKYFKIVSR